MKRILIPVLFVFLLLTGCSAEQTEKVEMTSEELLAQGYTAEEENGVMFETHDTHIYNYCPTILELADGTRHIYFCTNRNDGEVDDHIGYRKAVKAQDDGKWYYSPLSYVLTPPGEDTVETVEDYQKPTFNWYSRHICDPSVIAGEFKYYDHTYSYLMAVLVCANRYCLDNEVAFAVADKPEGPWTLCDDTVNPCVKCKRRMADWGVGQPDILSVDQKGQILLTYTMHGIGAVWQVLDCSNLQDIVKTTTIASPAKTGTEQRQSKKPYAFYNAAYAYDAENQQIWMLVENLPHALEDEATYPNQVGTVQCLYRLSLKGDLIAIAKGCTKDKWELLYTIDPTVTGRPRNHNACIIRDAYGWLLKGDTVDLGITVNDAGEIPDNTHYLWSYRIARVEYEKEKVE